MKLFRKEPVPIITHSDTARTLILSCTLQDAKYLSRFRHRDPDSRLWTDADLTAKGLSGGGYEYEYKGVRSLWRCPEETMRKLDEEGRLHFTKAGGIRLKRYLDDTPGVPSQTLWTDILLSTQKRLNV